MPLKPRRWLPKQSKTQWETVEQWTYTWIGDTNKVATSIESKTETIANSFELKQNYPNPFNPTTTIEYSVGKASNVKISVYNMLGQELAVLVNGKHQAGTHLVKFDAAKYSTGVYFYKIEAGNFVQTRKMLLVK